MIGMSRILRGTSVAAIALTVGLSLPNDARAQSCDPPGAALTASTGSTIPQIITSATNIISGISSSFNSFIGPITSGLGAVGGITGCHDLVSCLQMNMSQLAATNTNNQTMSSSVIAKGNDYLATNHYALTLQSAQAHMAVENGVNTGTNSNLAYQNNLSCVPATAASEAAADNFYSDQMRSTDPYKPGSYTYPTGGGAGATGSTGGGPSTAYAFTAHNSVKDISQLFKAALPFYKFTDTNGVVAHHDSNIAYLMGQGVFDDASGTTDDVNAMNMYISYFLGLPPEPPPGSSVTTPSNDPQSIQNAAAVSEKMAFYTLAQMPMQEEAGLHTGKQNPTAAPITAMYSAQNIPINMYGTAPAGEMSKAAQMKAKYRLFADDPNTYQTLGGLSPTKTLQFIAGILVQGNELNYERYLVERENLLITDGILSLQMRQANFSEHP
jgi:hypothetical protein